MKTILAALLLTLTGCRLRLAGMLLLVCCLSGGPVRADIPVIGRLFGGKKRDKHAEMLVETQQSLLRFANEYSMRMVGGVEDLRRGGNPLPRRLTRPRPSDPLC